MNFSGMEDATLIERIREKKSDEAFAALSKRYLPLMRRRVNQFWQEYLSCRQEDLEQVAMLALHKAALRFDPSRGVSFGAFAGNIIHNTLCDYVRDIGYTADPLPEDDGERTERSPEDLVADSERLKSLLRVVRETLSPYELTVFTRHVLLGEKLADVAAEVGKDVHSVENAVTRAKAKLRKKLSSD